MNLLFVATDPQTSVTVFTMSSGTSFTASVANSNNYYIKQVQLLNVSIPTGTVTATALNSKETTVSVSGSSILFDRIEVTLTDDFIGTLSPTVIYESGAEKTNLNMGADNKL